MSFFGHEIISNFDLSNGLGRPRQKSFGQAFSKACGVERRSLPRHRSGETSLWRFLLLRQEPVVLAVELARLVFILRLLTPKEKRRTVYTDYISYT